MRKFGKKVWRMAWYDFLADHPLCQECKKQGIKELATTIYNPTRRAVKGKYLDLENCITLCPNCYRKIQIYRKIKGSVSSGE